MPWVYCLQNIDPESLTSFHSLCIEGSGINSRRFVGIMTYILNRPLSTL